MHLTGLFQFQRNTIKKDLLETEKRNRKLEICWKSVTGIWQRDWKLERVIGLRVRIMSNKKKIQLRKKKIK